MYCCVNWPECCEGGCEGCPGKGLHMNQAKASRRTFLLATGAGVATALAARRARAAETPLRIAMIGCGGIIAPSIILAIAPMASVDCPCYADVDVENTALIKMVYPNAVHYADYRQMFDKQAKDFDAVIINTPDHHHYPATLMAMQLGKHVYTQKPLTHTVWEARQLALAAAKYKVATQMGNQGHADEDTRRAVDYIRSGMLGEVREAHAWTNRPLWPQGGTSRREAAALTRSIASKLGLSESPIWPQAVMRPEGDDPVPETLNWDCWLGPAPFRPYKKNAYHPVMWRGWYDFGTGALGDETPHLVDAIFWGLDARAPAAVEPVTTMCQPADSETYPGACVMKWEFPANGSRPGFALYWHERGLTPPLPPDLESGLALPESGSLIIGSKATLLLSGEGARDPRILPDAKHREMGAPPVITERSPGHLEEWMAACRGDKPLDFPKSNFFYAGPFTEAMLLGNVAARVQRRIEWDSANLQVTNLSAANQHITKQYREGWQTTL